MLHGRVLQLLGPRTAQARMRACLRAGMNERAVAAFERFAGASVREVEVPRPALERTHGAGPRFAAGARVVPLTGRGSLASVPTALVSRLGLVSDDAPAHEAIASHLHATAAPGRATWLRLPAGPRSWSTPPHVPQPAVRGPRSGDVDRERVRDLAP